jgi:hypothetical protein
MEGAGWCARAGLRSTDGIALPHALTRRTGDLRPADRRWRRRLNANADAFDGFLSLRRERDQRLARSPAQAIGSSGRREAHASAPRLWRYPLQARALAALSAGTGMRSTLGRGDLEMSVGADAVVVGGERDDDPR